MSALATLPYQSIVCDRSTHFPNKYMVADVTVEQVLPAQETLNMGICKDRYMEQQKGTHMLNKLTKMDYAVVC